MAHLLRSSIFAFVFITSLAHADDFVCRLAENSTKSNDPSLILPSQVAASFGSDGQTVKFTNAAISGILNCTLRYDHLNNSHLIFAASGVEGVSRQADILALSVERFFMSVQGEDREPVVRKWSADYGCLRVKTP